MRGHSFLSQQVNFIVSIVCVGSAALLGMVLMIEAAEMPNPVAEIMAQNIEFSGY